MDASKGRSGPRFYSRAAPFFSRRRFAVAALSVYPAPPNAEPIALPPPNGLTQLGQPTTPPDSPDTAILERVPAPDASHRTLVRFTAPEFTSLCPITAQPDFAHIVIDYVPDTWLVESKSLKLFLGSFRNHGAFHEACTLHIATRLIETLSPVWLRIGAYFYPRGGIPIDVFWQSASPPEGIWIPDQGVPAYRGRG
jgi:7-cyano-7-deazaguanine reductase